MLSMAQENLVPNGGFETLVDCPTSNQDWNVVDWTNPIGFSPDNYNTCASPTANYSASVPLNVHGFQSAFDGDGYVGIVSFAKTHPDTREYIQTVLTDTLTGGIRYYAGLHVSPADRFQYAISTIGAAITVEPPPVITVGSPNGMLGADPQILKHGRLPLTDTAKWVLISDTILAQGGERYLSIGNFHSDDESDTLRFNPNQPPIYGSPTTYAYYYIDDVFVYAIDTVPNGIAEQEAIGFEVYPNPATDVVRFRVVDVSAAQAPLDMMVRVLDAVGREVLYEQTLKQVQGDGSIDISALPSGIYFLELTKQAGRKAVRKFMRE